MTWQNDTIACDAERLAHWQDNPAYDYNRELMTTDWNLFQWIQTQIVRLLTNIFGSSFARSYSGIIMIALLVIIILLIAWAVYRKRISLFTRSGTKIIKYAIREDTIYGIDFEAAISSEADRHNYKEAIRLLYLQTLKWLSDEGIIDWQRYKTPTQYLYELKSGNGRIIFHDMTTIFMSVRYGNFEASEQLFNDMTMMQKQLMADGCHQHAFT